MEDLYLSTEIAGQKRLCISQLSAKTYREAGGKGLGGDYGYFVYETNMDHPESGIEVIAKVVSIEAAIRLFDILSATRVPA